MPDVDDAAELVTDPDHLTRVAPTGPERQFLVKQNRVLKALRDAGAGKAEARELALQALEKVGGGAELRASRGASRAGDRSGREVETWWVPADAVRWPS